MEFGKVFGRLVRKQVGALKRIVGPTGRRHGRGGRNNIVGAQYRYLIFQNNRDVAVVCVLENGTINDDLLSLAEMHDERHSRSPCLYDRDTILVDRG